MERRGMGYISKGEQKKTRWSGFSDGIPCTARPRQDLERVVWACEEVESVPERHGTFACANRTERVQGQMRVEVGKLGENPD